MLLPLRKIMLLLHTHSKPPSTLPSFILILLLVLLLLVVVLLLLLALLLLLLLLLLLAATLAQTLPGSVSPRDPPLVLPAGRLPWSRCRRPASARESAWALAL